MKQLHEMPLHYQKKTSAIGLIPQGAYQVRQVEPLSRTVKPITLKLFKFNLILELFLEYRGLLRKVMNSVMNVPLMII